MGKRQKGFAFLAMTIVAFLAWGGAVGVAVDNANKHPEISKPGRA